MDTFRKRRSRIVRYHSDTFYNGISSFVCSSSLLSHVVLKSAFMSFFFVCSDMVFKPGSSKRFCIIRWIQFFPFSVELFVDWRPLVQLKVAGPGIMVRRHTLSSLCIYASGASVAQTDNLSEMG